MTPATWTDLACVGITAVVFGIALRLAGRPRRPCTCPDCTTP